MRLYASHSTFFFRLLLEPWMLPQGFHPSFLAFIIPKCSRTYARSTRMGEYGRPKVRRRLFKMHRLGIVSFTHLTPPASSSGANLHISALAAAYPDDVDQRFAKHWYGCHPCLCHARHISLTSSKRSTWFTQDDVNQIQQAKLNTVRVPVSQVRWPL